MPMKPALTIRDLFSQISACSVLLSDVLGLDCPGQKHNDCHFFLDTFFSVVEATDNHISFYRQSEHTGASHSA